MSEANSTSWFFADIARVAALFAAIDECRGTPWAQHGRVAGREGGLDCVSFVEYVFTAAGVGQGREFTFLRTSADYQTARTYLRILHMLRGQDGDPQSKWLSEIFAEVPLPIPQGALPTGETMPWLNPDSTLFVPGDLAILRHGGMFHLPVMTRGRHFVDCVKGKGVDDGNMHDPTYSNHLIALFRARKLNLETRNP
jgi:hypothetical protein